MDSELYLTVLDGKKILVVEDNPANQLVMKRLFKRVGIEGEFAENGQLALEKYKTSHDRWDLILMDCEMPVMDGYDTTNAIRHYEQEAGLDRKMIIGVSAHAIDDLKRKAMDQGMDDYLTKPIEREALYQTIAGHLLL